MESNTMYAGILKQAAIFSSNRGPVFKFCRSRRNVGEFHMAACGVFVQLLRM
jgi:hypothetical protein